MRGWRWLPFALCSAAGALVACNGGTGSVPVPVAVPSSTPVALAALAPFDVSESAVPVPVPASSAAGAPPITLDLPSTSQVLNAMDLDADADVAAGTTFDAETTNEGLGTVPAPTSAERRLLATPAVKTLIETVGVRFSQTVSLSHRPTFTFTFAAGYLVPANYYLEYYDSSQPQLGWQDPFEGPGVISGNTLLFVDTSNRFTFFAAVWYYFELYVVSLRSTPTPFPAPTSTGVATPAPTPSPIIGQLIVTPATLSFSAPGQTQQLTASEAGYGGGFFATVADFRLGSVTEAKSGAFLITAGANAGTSFVTVTDDKGKSVEVPLTVTLTVGTINSVKRP